MSLMISFSESILSFLLIDFATPIRADRFTWKVSDYEILRPSLNLLHVSINSAFFGSIFPWSASMIENILTPGTCPQNSALLIHVHTPWLQQPVPYLLFVSCMLRQQNSCLPDPFTFINTVPDFWKNILFNIPCLWALPDCSTVYFPAIKRSFI